VLKLVYACPNVIQLLPRERLPAQRWRRYAEAMDEGPRLAYSEPAFKRHSNHSKVRKYLFAVIATPTDAAGLADKLFLLIEPESR
jgi:hypothetical protein